MVQLLEKDKGNEILARRIQNEMRWETSINEEVGVMVGGNLYVCIKDADGVISIVEEIPLCG